MINYEYYNPTKIIFGKSTEQSVGEQMAKLGKKALLHYGGGSIKTSGLYDTVIQSLKDNGVDFVELGGVVPNPRISLARVGIELCRAQSVDCIIAVGGGSVIDSAKAISAGVHYDGDVWDFFNGTVSADDRAIVPLGVVLTIPAAGSESSPSCVMTNEDGLLKRNLGSNAVRPKFAILNPELTYTLPFYQTACGIADMMAHIMERYFTRVDHVDVTDRMCEAVMRSIIINAKQLVNNPNDYNARAEIMQAGTIAHNDSLHMGRVGDWASHGIEHELSAMYDIAHGAGLAIVFPAWMKYVYKVDANRFVQFATRVFDVDISLTQSEDIVAEGISRLEEFFASLKLPIRLSELNIDSSKFVEMAKKCARRGNFMELNESDVEAIYNLAK